MSDSRVLRVARLYLLALAAGALALAARPDRVAGPPARLWQIWPGARIARHRCAGCGGRYWGEDLAVLPTGLGAARILCDRCLDAEVLA